MEERAADMAAPATGAGDRSGLRVCEGEKHFIRPRRDHRGVVEFMPAYRRAGPPERAVSKKPGLPVAEMQLARRETGHVSEQADHGMARPLGVLKAFAEHHVAAALA